MYVHAFVVICLLLNGTQCQEIEIVPADYRAVTSVMDCAMGGMIFASGGITDREGALWRIKGIRCKTTGEMPTTAMQDRLRSTVR